MNTRDVVLGHDESKARGFWKLALVCHLITGKDGHLRGPVVKTGSGSLETSTTATLTIKIHHKRRITPTLRFLLSSPDTESVSQVSGRSVRNAAERARHLNQAVANYEQSDDKFSD